jgi:hypothetical protein
VSYIGEICAIRIQLKGNIIVFVGLFFWQRGTFFADDASQSLSQESCQLYLLSKTKILGILHFVLQNLQSKVEKAPLAYMQTQYQWQINSL